MAAGKDADQERVVDEPGEESDGEEVDWLICTMSCA